MKYLLVLFFATLYEIDASCPNGTFPNASDGKCYFIPNDFGTPATTENNDIISTVEVTGAPVTTENNDIISTVEVTGAPEIDVSCPNGTFPSGRMCYFIPHDSENFILAEMNCQEQNGDLASIEDANINAHVTAMAKAIFGSNVTYAWLGGRKDRKGTWIWSDGQNFTYTHWASGNPDNNNDDNCMVLNLSNGKWYSHNCYDIIPYICDFLGNVTTTKVTTKNIMSTVEVTSAPVTTENNDIISTVEVTGVPVTTDGPINPLSNSDGTPCNCNTSTMWLDLILIADRSKSIGVGGLGSIGTQLATNLYGINIAQNGSDYYTRVGLMVFSSDVQVIGDLNKYNSYNDLTNDLLNLESYHKTDDKIVNIYAALKSAQDMFQNEAANNANRKARQVVLLFASSYNQIDGNNPVVIANQMNNSNVFIITVDYNDVQGAATQLLSQISTPFMNFSSGDSNDLANLANTFNEINSALCYSNCVCPASMTQLITYNSDTGRQTYFADCYIAYLSGSFATYAERACEEIRGTLVSLQTSPKTNFVINSVANKNNTKLTRFHTGLHRDINTNWVWYDYQNTSFPLGAFSNWAPGFSSSSAGDCAYIEQLSGTTWGWATESCIGQNPYQYICQVRACDSTYGTCDCTTWKNDPSCS